MITVVAIWDRGLQVSIVIVERWSLNGRTLNCDIGERLYSHH